MATCTGFTPRHFLVGKSQMQGANGPFAPLFDLAGHWFRQPGSLARGNQLYNLISDPAEANNLSTTPAGYQAIANVLAGIRVNAKLYLA